MYTKVIEKRPVTIKHIITFHAGIKSSDLIKDLKKVPINAKLDDFNEEECSLIFEEEKIL